eukprot:28138-Pelagococcus_subviridis.AAC.1
MTATRGDAASDDARARVDARRGRSATRRRRGRRRDARRRAGRDRRHRHRRARGSDRGARSPWNRARCEHSR